MEISSMTWRLSDMGIDDMNSLNDLSPREWTAALDEEFPHSFSSESYSSYNKPNYTPSSSTNLTYLTMEAPQSALDKPTKQKKATKRSQNASSTMILSFGSQNSSDKDDQSLYEDIVSGSMKIKNKRKLTPCPNVSKSEISFFDKSFHTDSKHGQASNIKVGNAGTRSSSHAQYHVIAERKRREKLNQKFIALSAIVPGLKKVDKASILSGTIKYVKQLQERVKTLEDDNQKRTVESMVFVNATLSSDVNGSYSDENFEKLINEPLPEIDVRVFDENILIRIFCSKQKGVLLKALTEIEKLKLLILSSSSLPLSESSLHINVVCKMEDQYCMTMKDLIKCLNDAIISNIL